MAQSDAPLAANSVSTAGFLLLLPLGLILLSLSALPQAESEAPQAATSVFVVWVVAVLAYFLIGFALQFGGLAVTNRHPDFTELYWNWSPLPASSGPYWGVLGLRGWALLGPAATPGVFDLFLRHIALLGVVIVPPAFILYRRVSAWLLLVFGAATGAIIYPLVGNWVWSAGWLANLGLTLNLGHGFVDAGVALPFVMAGWISLAAIITFQRKTVAETPKALETSEADAEIPAPKTEFLSVPMPAAYLPILSFLGLGLVLWSWSFLASVQHIPTATQIALPRAALNGVLAAFSAGAATAFYSRFTTSQFDPLMISRGTLAGLVMVSAAAPFIAPWQALLIGVAGGLLLPPLLYTIEHRFGWQDEMGSVAAFAGLGSTAWLLLAIFADGQSGAGWNQIGPDQFLGVSGQGVSGFWVAAGFVADWPGQFNAQLLGTVVVAVWSFGLALGLFKGMAWFLAKPSQPEPEALPDSDPTGDIGAADISMPDREATTLEVESDEVESDTTSESKS